MIHEICRWRYLLVAALADVRVRLRCAPGGVRNDDDVDDLVSGERGDDALPRHGCDAYGVELAVHAHAHGERDAVALYGRETGEDGLRISDGLL